MYVSYVGSKGAAFTSDNGTRIICNIRLDDKTRGKIFEKEKSAWTPSPSYNLYLDAVHDFENNLYFKYVGEIIAGKLTYTVVESALESLF